MATQSLRLTPPAKPFHARVRVPGSKSITNRALPIAALARGSTTLTGVLFADDTRQMIHALQSLGYPLQVDEPARTIQLLAGDRHIVDHATLTCGNSGTTIRFLAAMLATRHGSYTLDGIARMRQRPIGQLGDQLRALGKQITYPLADGYPPITLTGTPLAGGIATFEDATSSQYISAILMAAPYAQSPVTVRLLGPVTSEPYVRMTLSMMQQFGVTVEERILSPTEKELHIPVFEYTARPYDIEPDASNASYFLAAAAVTPGASCTTLGLGRNSLQGDVEVASVLQQMGAIVQYDPDGITVQGPAALRGVNLDMNHIPDMVQTVAVVALFAAGPTTLRNVANMRVKETDRLDALETELSKLGATVSTTTDSITIHPPAHPVAASIATYDDHRMAMAFAVAGLRIPGLEIQDPACTAKTYPHFFTDFQTAIA